MVSSSASRCLAASALLIFVGCSASPVSDGPETKLDTTTRQTCAVNDYACLCRRSVDYANAIRARHSLGPMAVGTAPMLANAVDHSKVLGAKFAHQDLTTVTNIIKCGVFCSGENIAMFSGPSSDPAKKCMDMWESSAGHLKNIIGSSDMTTIGIYKNGDNTYCTQTFGLRTGGIGKMSDRGCIAA